MFAGAVQLSETLLPGSAELSVGAPGGLTGAVGVVMSAFEAAPVPTELVALTVKA